MKVHEKNGGYFGFSAEKIVKGRIKIIFTNIERYIDLASVCWNSFLHA
jgi:hypothetical protein